MTEFDKLNLRVVPIQDPLKFNKLPNFNGYPLKWSDPANYCDWEEREDIYPGVQDWYVIPPARSTFFQDGMEIGYWVLDIDNHEGDRFKEAIAFLKTCNLPPSLTIRTPSGGLHIYYKALKEDLPAQLGRNKEVDLPIEIKVSTGVVAPNGRDRVVIRDLPVAYFTVTEDNPISKIAKIKSKKPNIAKKETDPNFPIEEEPFPEVGPGDRHNTLMATACSLYTRGCPPEKIQKWGEEFYLRTGRKQQLNEISNIVRDAVNFIDEQEAEAEAEAEAELEELTQEAQQGTPPQTSPEPQQNASTTKDDTTTISQPKPTLESILGPCEELTGWDAVLAKSVFSDKGETKQYIKEELKDIPPEDRPFVRGMLDPNKMRATWASTPYKKQLQYESFKDSVKMLLQK